MSERNIGPARAPVKAPRLVEIGGEMLEVLAEIDSCRTRADRLETRLRECLDLLLADREGAALLGHMLAQAAEARCWGDRVRSAA